jgi:pimeloyl-ACP methyl ester carboxylesterase
VIGVLDQIGARQVHLIGHSLGGSIAWLISQSQPDRVTRLVIEDSPPAKPGLQRIDPGPRPQEALPCAWEAIEQVAAQISNAEAAWWDRLDSVTAKVLLLAGGQASHVPQHLFAEAQTLLKDAQIVEIPVGHHIHRDALDRFLAAVVPFLTQLSTR